MSDPRSLNAFRYINEENATGTLAGDVTGPSSANVVEQLQGGVPVSATSNYLTIKIGAGLNSTIGGLNTCYGPNAGPNLTSGVRNTFVGALAGSGVSTGSDNIVIGTHSPANGDKSILIGDYLPNNTGCNGCIIIGHDVGPTFTDAENCVGIGNLNNVGGAPGADRGTAIGYNAITQVTEGLALGGGALAQAWVLNTSGPFAIGGTAGANTGIPDLTGGGPPSGGLLDRLRIRLNGANYCIGLYADE